jgi:hypothetical protein
MRLQKQRGKMKTFFLLESTDPHYNTLGESYIAPETQTRDEKQAPGDIVLVILF